MTALAALLALAGGCMMFDDSTGSAPPPLEVTAADHAAATVFTPATAATNQLGLELLRQLAGSQPAESHLLISPYSIQEALAMAYAGADGDTRAEMARVLHFPGDDATLAASFGALRDTLEKGAKSANAMHAAGPFPIELHVANRLFGQAGYAFRSPFLKLLQDGYGAPFEQVDFRHDLEPARAKINGWVGEQTNEKVRDLIPPGGLSETTRLVLVNALYFKGAWQDRFEKADTDERSFRVRGTDQIKVPTMVDQTYNVFGCAKGPGFTAVTLPYRTGALQFLILLPDDPSGVNALAAKLTPALLQACARLKPPELPVEVYMPKLHFEPPTMPLGAMLRTLGLKTAFDNQGSANFKRMADPPNPEDALYISEVFHKTYLELDEEGTEAAAATATAMVETSAVNIPGPPPPPPIIVHVDHPFLFAIQHRESDACLFLGRVEDPR